MLYIILANNGVTWVGSCLAIVSSDARKGDETHGGICHKVTQGWFPDLCSDFH